MIDLWEIKIGILYIYNISRRMNFICIDYRCSY